MPFTNTFNFLFVLNYFDKSALYQCIVPSQNSDQLYVNFLFSILSFCHKCLPFQFLSFGIRIQIPIITGVQKWGISSWRNHRIFRKNVLLPLNLPNKGHVYVNGLFYILSFCHKYLMLRFLSPRIRIHISILILVQNGGISSCRNSHILP